MPDRDGAKFPALEDAYLEAYKAARELWHQLLLKRQDPTRCAFEIADPYGALIDVLHLTEFLRDCRPAGRVDPRPIPVFADAKKEAWQGKKKAWQGRVLFSQVNEQLLLTRERTERTNELLGRAAVAIERFRTLSGESNTF
jgi:hypothetical protein